MPVPGPRLSAGLTVVLSITTGFVTNLVTDEWSWTVGAAFAVLVVASVVFAVAGASAPGSRTRVREVAKGGSTMSGGRIDASHGADVRIRATRRGRFLDSSTTARGADVDRRADGSEIRSRDVEAT